MAIWPSFFEQVDENGNISACSDSNLPFIPPTLCPFGADSSPTSPRLEVRGIDAIPFSQNFADLFDGLGLHVAQSAKQKHRLAGHGSPDISHDVENYTNIKDIDLEWRHDDIEEIMVISPKRTTGLPTIHEDAAESSVFMTPTAALSEFQIEEPDNFSRAELPNNGKMCIRRDDGTAKKYLIKRRRARKNTQWVEQTILETLASLYLPFLVDIRWAFQSGEHIYAVMDHHVGGTLADLVAIHGALGSHRAVFYASELVSAISSLNAAGIVHRDIQPRNIFLDSEGHIVLTNFAHAEFLSANCGGASIGSLMDFAAFTMNEYRAPEVYMGWSHNGGVDCWSFGMVLYFMFFGTHPYGEREGVADDRWFYDRVVGFGIPTESLRLVHPMARDLILKCLERNPSMRWSIDKIKTHGYFALVDWDQVFAKRLDVPSFSRTAMEVDRANFQAEVHRRHVFLNPSSPENDRHQLALNPASTLRRAHSAKGSIKRHSLQDAPPPVLPELFRPVSYVSIPTIIQEEEEPTSTSASTGHPCVEEHQQRPEEGLDPAERMSRFWADIDRGEQGSATSIISLEFGGSNGIPYSKAPKLRKHRSAVQSSHRLFSLSTSSFQNKLWKKPRSTGALRQSKVVQKHVDPIEGLPMGVHQIGSGIGFTYNVPAAAPSKVSVCSFVPPTCTHLFHGGFSVLNIGLGLGQSARRATAAKSKEKDDRDGSVVSSPTASGLLPVAGDYQGSVDPEPLTQPPPHSRSREEVGSGTFIRDMYRTPSWILSPPESLPSPLALVNSDLESSSSPVIAAVGSAGSTSEPELLTPATLVDCAGEDDDEVNISIPKGLKLDLDFELCEWVGAPDSTLRLVPRVPLGMKLSYVDHDGGGVVDESMETEMCSVDPIWA